jgi:ureidoglycolate lyase
MAMSVVVCSQTSLIEVKPLKQHHYSEFGTVIENPDLSREPGKDGPLPANAIHANQGTAIKYQNVTNMLDLYTSAPSKVASRAAMNMFVCAPRTLGPKSTSQQNHSSKIQPFEGAIFPVEILERHPFTTQTFIPIGLSPDDQNSTAYLVIVAPSLPESEQDAHLPVPSGQSLPGRGLPDLTQIKAFIATGGQAVTYGAGTWHAPMVVIGKKAIDFVVVQFANGVEIEDCQEVEIRCPDRDQDGSGIGVALRIGDWGHWNKSGRESKL